MTQNNWYLLTGAPSTGKTTAFDRVHELFKDLMVINERMGYMGYPTIVTMSELARQLLQQEPHPELGSQEFEEVLARMQVMSEQRLVDQIPFESYVVLVDRTLLDVYAYSIVNGLDSPISFDDLRSWMQRYDHVFVFGVKNSVYFKDGVRGEDEDRQRIEDEIIATCEALKIPFTLLEGHISKRHEPLAMHVRKDIDTIFMGSSTQQRNIQVQREDLTQTMMKKIMAAQQEKPVPLEGTMAHGPSTD